MELIIGGGADVVDSTVPNVADTSGTGALSVIQLAAVDGTGHSRFFLRSAGAVETVSACTMVSHVNDFIVTEGVDDDDRMKEEGKERFRLGS